MPIATFSFDVANSFLFFNYIYRCINNVKGKIMKEKITIEKLPSIQNENIESLYKYVNLINKCLDRSLNKEQPFKYEIHHIIPKSFGGSNSTKNLVKLDLKEHFLAHLYLSEAYKNTKHEHKAHRALWCMTNGKLDSVKKFNEFDYESLRKGFIMSMSGENNPRYGKSPYEYLDEEQLNDLNQRKSNTWKNMTNERKKEMTNKRLLSLDNRNEEQKIKSHEKRVKTHSGENNGFYGKKHSEETKKKLSEKQKSISIEERQKRSEKMKQTLANKTEEEKLIMKKK